MNFVVVASSFLFFLLFFPVAGWGGVVGGRGTLRTPYHNCVQYHMRKFQTSTLFKFSGLVCWLCNHKDFAFTCSLKVGPRSFLMFWTVVHENRHDVTSLHQNLDRNRALNLESKIGNVSAHQLIFLSVFYFHPTLKIFKILIFFIFLT